jgi:hypothetical protein
MIEGASYCNFESAVACTKCGYRLRSVAGGMVVSAIVETSSFERRYHGRDARTTGVPQAIAAPILHEFHSLLMFILVC